MTRQIQREFVQLKWTQGRLRRVATRLTCLSALLGFTLACSEEESAPGSTTCTKGPGVICTFMGTGVAGLTDDGLSPTETELYLPQDMTVGPDKRLYVVDWNNHRIRVLIDDHVETLVGTGYLGDAPDGPAKNASLNHPTHVAVDAKGKLLISAWHNSKVMRYDPKTEQIVGVCGTGARAFNGDDLPGRETALDLPVATIPQKDGSLLIADQANQRVRRLSEDDKVTTVVGTGIAGYSGDGGPALLAQLNLPVSQSAAPAGRIAMDGDGNLFIADTVNHVIRKVDTEGTITTVAGTGEAGNGKSTQAVEVRLDTPTDVAADAAGNVYIADTYNSCVRKLKPNGSIETAVGECGKEGYSGDGGPATKARVDRPYGVEVGPDGTLYVADTHNHVIRVVYPKK